MINVGDLVRNTDEFSDSHRNIYTVLGIIPSYLFNNEYQCYRNRIIRVFREHQLEKLDSPPQFVVGTVVTPKRSYSYPFHNSRFGVVQASNKVGSLVRIWNVCCNQEHMVEYVSNRNLRKA